MVTGDPELANLIDYYERTLTLTRHILSPESIYFIELTLKYLKKLVKGE